MWLPGVTAVDHARRRDPAGPARRQRRVGADHRHPRPRRGARPSAAAREALEETGVVVSVDRLASTSVQPAGRARATATAASYLDLTFACTYVSGEAHVADDESSDVRWCPRRRDAGDGAGDAPADRRRAVGRAGREVRALAAARRRRVRRTRTCRRRRSPAPCRRRDRRRAGRPAASRRARRGRLRADVDAGTAGGAAEERLVECAADQRPPSAGDLDLLDARHRHRDVPEPSSATRRRAAGRPCRWRRRTCRPPARTA